LTDDDDDSFSGEFAKRVPSEDPNKSNEDGKKTREKMMKTMKKAGSAVNVLGKKSKGMAHKAKSARNVFEQTTAKVFSRGREEGRGLLKSED
jgi:hypothetical protein